ncbi:nuclear transport factor 2 family protein [Labilibacter sediminis]|nr:nuclear transport factor 2 family protein [Labilibacter sediminis]
MKKIILSIVLSVIGFSAYAQSDHKELEAIKKVINVAYLQGVQNIGDMEKIDSGFHPDFRMQVLEKDGSLNNVSLKGFKKRVKTNIDKGILPRAEGKQVSINFLDINVEQYVAAIKMEYIQEGKSVYIDYMQLYKFPDGWKIVNKIYYTVGD